MYLNCEQDDHETDELLNLPANLDSSRKLRRNNIIIQYVRRVDAIDE